jgi:hypothetical protein
MNCSLYTSFQLKKNHQVKSFNPGVLLFFIFFLELWGTFTFLFIIFCQEVKKRDSLNTAGEVVHLSIPQRQDVIKCIHKEDRSKSHLKNWRPISLLNVDIKKNRFICNCKPYKTFLRQINRFDNSLWIHEFNTYLTFLNFVWKLLTILFGKSSVKFLSHPRVETRISHTAKNSNCAVSLVRKDHSTMSNPHSHTSSFCFT